jgi:protein SCO1/2
MRRVIVPVLVTLVACICAAPRPVRAADPPCHTPPAEQAGGQASFTTSYQRYDVPPIQLTDQDGNRVDVSQLGTTRPVAVNFIFTTCTTICPVMSASFLRLQQALGDEIGDLQMVSISIDPEYDTPGVLKSYADQFRAGPRWRFLTGDASDVTTTLKAFDALVGSKMNHKPFTLFKFPDDGRWVRVDGLVGAATLAEEYLRLASD